MEEKLEEGQKINEENAEERRENAGDQQCTNQRNFASSGIQEDERMAAAAAMKKKLRKEALREFKCIVEDAILGNYLLEKPRKNLSKKDIKEAIDKLKEISIWGVPLLPSKGHEGNDTVLLKFLKAKDFNVIQAFEMLRKALKWRKEYKTDGILEEDLHLDHLEKVVYTDSVDKEGHPLYYSVFGAFKDRELYNEVLGTEEGCENFLRWIIQFMEKSIKQLSFRAGEADSILQITDYKGFPGAEMKELRSVSKKAFMLLEAYYPEIICKNILINVPLWYYTSNILRSKLMTERTKKKFIFARPSRVTRTLLKYISPENLPVEYGGLKRENDVDFSTDDKASELIIWANAMGCIQIPVPEGGVTVVWDFTVVGWDATYKEEFIPDDEGSYRILIRQDKEKKMGQSERNSFYITEPGKIVVAIENASLKKKMVCYRHKAKPTLPIYKTFMKKI